MGQLTKRTVLVLGAYGMIGSDVARVLAARGHTVRGLGRDPAQIARFPWIDWTVADMADLAHAEAWGPVLQGVDVVVNAAGSLQDGAGGRVADVHTHAIAALVRALGERKIVQISAAGVGPDASTEFFATKADGDAAVRSGASDFVILRPGLVLAPGVYGSTALLRMLAALPWVQPLAFPGAQLHVISARELSDAVVQAAEGALPVGFEADLVADAPVTLAELVAAIRGWLGFAPARFVLAIPEGLASLIGRFADVLGWLGWRSPLRTTALTIIADGVRGDPGPWRGAAGQGFEGLEPLLARQSATLQDRWHARLYLLLPVLIAGLSLFWLTSGLIGLVQLDSAEAVLADSGLSPAATGAAVIGGALADIGLGLAVLVRKWARPACLGMIALSLGYLGAGTVLTPELWADPLGPFVKVIPGILLAAAIHALLEPR